MKSRTVYLDNAASTRPAPSVVEAMLPFLGERYGNPSSLHALGLDAHRALEEARERIARLLQADPEDVVFTPSGSASNNLIIKGLIPSLQGKTVLLTALEHPSVVEPAKALAMHGIEVCTLRCDREGRIDLDDLARELQERDCGLLCVIHGSNEVGTVQEVDAIGRLLRELSPETWFHLDAVQTVGHIPFDPRKSGVHSLTFSSHKIHGPRGVGVLALYHKADIVPLVAGGGQEVGRWSGTENVAAVVGAARSLELAMEEMPRACPRMAQLRNNLASEIDARIPDILINGDPFTGVPHILSVSFAGVLGEVLLHHLEEKGVMVSTGSACHSHWNDLSDTLKSLEIPDRFVRGTLRFSLSKYTTQEEITYTADVLADRLSYLREVGVR